MDPRTEFLSPEENIALSNATAVGDMAQYIKSDNDSISLHFCKYTPGKRLGSEEYYDFELLVLCARVKCCQ